MSDAKTFDPGRYLTKVGSADYLEVRWRLVWLREVHPDAMIETKLLHYGDQYAVVWASVSIPGGGSATGLGSETYGDFRDFMEKAETKAIGRALAALGFGTQFCPDHDFGGEHGRVVDSPVGHSAGAGATFPPRGRTTSQNAIPAQADDPNAITAKQLGMIRAVAEEKGIPPEEIRAMHGKPSAKDLTKQEASKLIERIQAMDSRIVNYDPRAEQDVLDGVMRNVDRNFA